MDSFFNTDFDIDKIVFVYDGTHGTGDVLHKNRTSHGIAFHLGGEKIYHYESGDKNITKQNSLNYMPKGSSYCVEVLESAPCYAINFEVRGELDLPPAIITVKNSAAILEHFRTAAKLWERKSEGYMLGCRAALYSILFILRQENSRGYVGASGVSVIQPALKMIHKRYSDSELTVTELAAACEITPEYLRRLFNRAYGSSPLRYINTLRITRARELIESGMYSVTEAALLSGFSDMSYFSRSFKREYGIPPSKMLNGKQ